MRDKVGFSNVDEIQPWIVCIEPQEIFVNSIMRSKETKDDDADTLCEVWGGTGCEKKGSEMNESILWSLTC